MPATRIHKLNTTSLFLLDYIKQVEEFHHAEELVAINMNSKDRALTERLKKEIQNIKTSISILHDVSYALSRNNSENR